MICRIYQHGLLVANSGQRHYSSIDIDIDPTSPLDEVGHQGNISSIINTISDATPHSTATYLACIAGGSVVPHKDRLPPTSHKKPTSTSTSSSYSTHQSSQSPPLLWIYNCTTHRWRSTYLTIGNSLSNASSFVNIPHKSDDQSCRIHPRTDTPIIVHYTKSLDELNPCRTPISIKSITSSSSCPSTPLAHSSFDYGDFSNHLDVRMSDFGGGYFSPPVDRPMKMTNYLLSSPIKHTITSSPSNKDKTIMRVRQRQMGFESTRQQRSSSVLISEHSHLAGGVSVVFAITWYGIHTIILLTQRRAFHCLEIVSREVTKASSMVGMPHPAVHKVIQLPPGYLPTLLEMRDVAVRHNKSSSEMSSSSFSSVRFPHSWREDEKDIREDAGSSTEGSTHRESNAGMDSCTRPTVADIADTCVVVVSDGKTMLCYSISRELQRLNKSRHSAPSTRDRASSRTGGVIYDYSVVELWDFHISSLTEQCQLFGPCLRMSASTRTPTAASVASSSSSSSGHKIALPIRETHLFFIRSCQLNGG